MSWSVKSIDDITEVVTKGTTPSTYGMPFTDEGINFVKAEALNGDVTLDRSGFTFIDDETHEKLKRSKLHQDDVLVTIAGANVGKCGYVRPSDVPANTNQAVGIVRVKKEEANPRYIYYHFKNPSTFAMCQGIGGGQAAQPNINLTMLKGFKVNMPDLENQNRIVDVLSQHDDLIENNKRRIELLEESARQLYKEWFVRFRFPGHEHVKIIDGVPEGWNALELGNVVTVIKNTVQPVNLPEGTPYIGLEHFPRRSFTLNGWESSEKVTSTKYAFKSGDILFGKIRPYFHKVGFTLIDGITSSDAIVLRPKHEKYYSIILSDVSSDQFIALASKTVREGSKMPRADWNVLQKTTILEPPENILDVFNAQILSIVEQCKLLSFQMANLTKARDLLLPKLMNGEIAV